MTKTASRHVVRKLLAGASVGAIALGSHGAAAQVAQTSVTSASTQTSVATSGATTTVSTTNVKGDTAFNRFGAFDVASANTVNLVLPGQTKNLVNVVNNDVRIDGTVNSRIAAANGQVGGNLFFLTSGGFLVGGTGTVNTGRLIVRGAGANGAMLNPDTLTGSSFDAEGLLSYKPVSTATIAGKINAPGGIDIAARGFTLAAGGALNSGAAGVAALQAAGAMVSTAGIVEGARLVKVNGGVAIVGTDTVAVAGPAATGGRIDARGTTIGGTALAGGIDVASAGSIVLGGTLSTWDGTASGTAGDIKIASSATKLIDNGLLSMSLGDFYTASTAASGVTVTGAIAGGAVDITSDAHASTAAEFNAYRTTVQFLQQRAIAKILDKVGSALDVFYTHTDAQSSIAIGGTADVAAKGALTVKANSISSAEGGAEAEAAGTNAASLSIAVGMAQVASSALVTVDGKLKAGGALTVAANNTATSDLEVQAVSTAQAKAGAVAYTDATVTSDVKINGGAKLDGASVSVTSTNTQGADDAFSNTASVIAKDESAAGGVAGVLALNVNANLTMNGTIGSIAMPGSVTIAAKTDTNEVVNNASARTGTGKLSDIKSTLAVFTGDKDGLMRDLLGRAADKGEELLFGKEEDPAKPDPDRSTTRIGAAVGVLFDNQNANLTVGGTIASSGAVAIDSLVKDATVRNSAKASVAAERDTDGQATSIAGAAAWGKTAYVSHAIVGGTVTADSLAVNATTERPRGGSYDLPFTDGNDPSDAMSWFDSLKPKANASLGIEQGFFTSVAGATAKTDSAQKAAISASIGVVDITADTRAWIDPMATLTLGKSLEVKALANITVMNLGGALPKGFGTAGGSAGGAAVAYTGIAPTTVAGIGKGVVLSRKAGIGAVDVDVDAKSVVQSITLAPQAGQGNAKTGSGTFATNDIGGATRAVVSKDARLDLGTGRFGLDALTSLDVWAVGGSIALTKADGTGNSGSAGSIGVAGALNLVEMDTIARVADTGGEYASAETGSAASDAGITAQTVAVTATSTGGVNAISVAGSATSTDPAKPKPGVEGTQTANEPKGTLDKIKGKLTYASGLIQAPLKSAGEKYTEYASTYASGVDKAEAAAQQDAISKGTPVTKGFGVAGSASVNLSTLNTRVETTSATFRAPPVTIPQGTSDADAAKLRAAAAGKASFVARAVEGVDMLSVTGGAAITTGSKPLDSNTLIAGAYGLSYSSNETRSTHTGTTVDGFGTVAVEAAANGSRIGAGLALSADTTKTPQGQTIAGSVSHLIARDGAAATFTGGRITGGGAAGGQASILAYNGLTMGAGAGGLAWSSNNAAGAAVTVIDVASPTGGAANARLVGAAVSGFDQLSVRGLTAARVAGVAAAGAINTSGDSSKKALAIGLSVNLVSMDSTALIDTGATGAGTVNVGAVKVYAGDLTSSDNEPIAAQGKTGGTAGTGMLGNYGLKSTDFASDDAVQLSDLKGGTQILSIAVPIAASRGTALGVGFGYNAIDNDRTASIIGGSADGTTPTITTGSVSVQAIDHSDILALGVGVGGSAEGAGLMGSVSRNLIEGSSSAGIGRSTGATGNLVLNVTGTPGATPNVSVGASGDGGIFSLAGAVGVGKTAAGGIAVGINDITRTTPAASGGLAGADSEAGLHAAIDGVSFKGTPDVDLLANSRGRIVGNALAIAASGEGASVAGAATANGLAPTIAANASRLSYLDASTGDLKIRAKDESSILSTALVVGISGQKGGVAAGVSVNRIDADVAASLKVAGGDSVRVRNLLVDARSTAATTAFGLGAGGGSKFGGAGSIAINLIKGDTAALLTYAGGAVNTTGSLGVTAKRDATIDVGAGALAFGAQGAAIGASIIVSEIGGETSAKITGDASNTGTITAFTGSGAGRSIDGVRTGALTAALPQFDALNDFGSLALNGVVKSQEASMSGVVVNASSTAATRTIAITGAISGQGVAVGVTGVVNNVTGTTKAEVTDANVSVGSGTAAQAGVGLDVRASSQQVGMTFAGAIAGSGAGVAAAAPVISDGYAGTTSALVKGGALSSTGTITVKAVGNQSSTALALAGAVSGSAGAAVAGVSPRFQSTTSATLDTPAALVARGADGVAVNADSSARALATFGSLAIGGNGAGAGAVVVATNENKTSADYKGRTGSDGLGNVAVDAAKVVVEANGTFDAMVAGASIAGSAGISLVGNGVGVVHRGSVTASADALNYNKPAGAVSVKATEGVSIVPVVGQVAIGASPTGAGASLGVIAVLSQSSVGATLSRPKVVANTVDVVATGYNQIDAMQLGVAVGGVGLGANVTYLGIGAVTDTGALTASSSGDTSDSKVAASSGSDGQGGNKNMAQLSAGGSRSGSQIAAQTSGATSSAERTSAAGSSSARDAFVAATPAAATVTAQVTGNTGSGRASLTATTLTIDSDANLRSKSTNAQLTGGIAAGSATVGITRNAAQALASLGAVDAGGTTLNLTATTGEAGRAGAPSTITNPTKAADAEIYSGTVGIGALAVGVADVKLQSKAQAESAGKLGFVTANIGAEDNTTARTYAVGAVAGGGAVNVTVAQAVKEGTVSATLASPTQSTSGTVNLTAKGLGGATAEAYAGSGGLIFAGNAAVANATDTRTVSATVLEGSKLAVDNLLVRASTVPLVNAYSYGVAVSGGVAAGASVANARAGGSVSALIGENSKILCVTAQGCVGGAVTVEGLVVTPATGANVNATAKGSAGGYLAAVNGASAIATTAITTNAAIGVDLNGSAGAALELSAHALTVRANRRLSQASTSTGVTAAGLLAVGVQRAESTSSGDTRAAIGNVDGSARGLADATVDADVLDTNTAKVVAGAGGLGAGVAALAETNSRGTATTEMLLAAGKTFSAGDLVASSRAAADYRANADSMLATAVGASGATTRNTVTTAATTNIGRDVAANAGNNARFEASSFKITAKNAVGVNSSDGGGVKGAGGGVASGSAALVDADLTQRATVNVRDGVALRQYGYASSKGVEENTRATFIDASVSTDRKHDATLEVGGVMQLPFAEIDNNYNAITAVNLGRNILIRGDQGIGIGTLTRQSTIDTAGVQIYGLAGVGGGKINSTGNSDGQVTVGDGTTIESLMDVQLSAGTSALTGASDLLGITTQVDTFNWTAAPLSTTAEANSNAIGNNRATIGAATIRSGRDVAITAMASEAKPSASGTGHNPYLELFSVTSGSGNTRSDVKGSIKLDGATLTAGYLSDRKIAITTGANGGTAITQTDAGDLGNADPDRLGKYLISVSSFSTLQYLSSRITALENEIGQGELNRLGVRDPGGSGVDATAARDAINAAGSSSEKIAELGTLYEARMALIATDGPNPVQRPGVVVGGALSSGSIGSDGGIFAAGGLVSLNTDAFVQGARASTVTANGGGKVTVTNDTGIDTFVGNIFVPLKSAGAILYAGKATASALPTNVAKVLPTGGSAADIAAGSITVTTGDRRSDIITLGDVGNIGGSFVANTKQGNYAQFGRVDVASFSVDAPNGLFTVSMPGQDFSQGQPLGYYYGNYGVALYSVGNDLNGTWGNGGRSAFGATNAVELAASWAAMRRLGLENQNKSYGEVFAKYDQMFDPGGEDGNDDRSNETNFNNMMRGLFIANYNRSSPTGTDAKNSNAADGNGGVYHRGSVIWSSCANTCEFFSNDGDLSGGQGGERVYLGFDGDSGRAFSNHYFYTTAPIAYRDTVIVANPTPSGTSLPGVYGAAGGSAKNSITATNVFITAKNVDISGTIQAGPNKERSVAIGTINGNAAEIGSVLAGASDGSISLNKSIAAYGGSYAPFAVGNINAYFVKTGTANGRATGYIQVDDVNAGAGGTITIAGKILNTNPLGTAKLKVLNGYANIAIDNQTGYELRLGTVNAGVQVDGRITLRDSGVTTEYLNSTAGGGVVRSVYTNGALTSRDTWTDGTGLSEAKALTYQPFGNIYYVWSDQRTAKRDISYNANSELQLATVSPWRWDTGGTAPTGGSYVNLDQVYGSWQNGYRTKTALAGSGAGYAQVAYADVQTSYDTRSFSSFAAIYSAAVPYQVTLHTETAVKATYPIKILFDQSSNGGLRITSPNAAVTLTGAVSYGGGVASISSANGTITTTGDGQVTANGVSLTARNGIGTIGQTPAADAPFRVNLLGGSVSALVSTGDINLALRSVASTSGVVAPVRIDGLNAPGNLKISSNADMVGTAGTAANVTAGGNITLDSGGRIVGSSYYGAGNLASQGLRVKLGAQGVLTATAAGDIAIEQVADATNPTGQTLRVGAISTPGDVLLKVPGSIVAADATVTVDQEKLARFVAAAKSLQLAPDCAANCGTQDAATLGTLDQTIRADGRTAYAKLNSTVPGEATAAQNTLIALFGFVPASEGAIATLTISRSAKIDYQIRNQGRDAFDRYAMFTPGQVAEQNRGAAVTQTVDVIGKVAAFTAKGGIALSPDSRTVSITDASSASLQSGGALYQIALSSLSANGQGVAAGATATEAQLAQGLQFYLDGLLAPVSTLLPGVLPNLTGLDEAGKATAVSKLINGVALADWVGQRSVVEQRNRAVSEALGKVQDINAFAANAGISLSADAKTVSVTDWGKDTLKPGGTLYQLGLATLRSVTDANGLRDSVPLPTQADVLKGLQIYLDGLRSPIADLLPNLLPTLSGSDAMAQRATISSAISTASLTAWATKQQGAAAAELTGLFGVVPVSRDSIASIAIDAKTLEARKTGSVWSQSMIDVAFPSTAFVPVADTQFETRKPVIKAQGVTIVAGNSIGAFDAQRTFGYDKSGFTGAKADEQLAAAYLASAGPGDLSVTPVRDGSGKVISVTFTTRREQPLTLNANGIVNAVAATDYATLAPSLTSGNGTVAGDIFLNNAGKLTLGTIVSEKWRTGTPAGSCALGSAVPATCESRIRLVAPDIVGTTSGAAALSYSQNGVTRRLDSGDGSALVMGGLVRIEASNGSIVADDFGKQAQKNRGSILVDAKALEVLRAAGDISLIRRNAATIGYANNGNAGTYGFGNDLIVGDVFAGGRLQLDNPYGGFFVGRIESVLESERRNSRIVAGTLAMRAAGDIGSPDTGSTGIVGQFDIQTPIVDQLVAGYDYATGRPAKGPAPAGLGTGSAFFALRGVVQFGGFSSSVLGGRGDITIGTLNTPASTGPEIKSSIKFLSDIYVGGMLNLTTDGDVNFPDPNIKITGLDIGDGSQTQLAGVDYRPGVMDLSRLALNLKGQFNYFNTRSIILGSLTAGGGTIESSLGTVTVKGTLYGNGGPLTPFTMKGKTGVEVGSTGLGSISLLSSNGDVKITGQSRATDLTIEGVNVSVASGLYGRAVSITAAPTGTVALGGAVMLLRDASDPRIASNFLLTGGTLGVSDIVSAQDAVTITGTSITAKPQTMFLNTGALTLTATGALNLDPSTQLVNIGTAYLSAGDAAHGGAAVTLSGFNGGLLNILAPVGITLGAATVGDAVTLRTTGALALNGAINAVNAVDAQAGSIAFAGAAGIRDASAIRLVATDAVTGSASTVLRSRGMLTLDAQRGLTLGQPGLNGLTLGLVKAREGSIGVAQGNLTIASSFASDGTDFRVRAGGNVAFNGIVTSAGNFGITAGGDLAFANPLTMSGGNGYAGLEIDAGGAFSMGRTSRITATAADATVRINAGSVAMDNAASINGASVALTARGNAALGDVKASETYAQTVSLRATGAVSAGTLTGGTTTITASGGGVTLRGPLKSGTLMISARDDLATNGVAATQATLTSSLGTIALNGTTRVMRPDAPTAARLSMTAGKAITIGGATSATGGMTLSSPSISTTGSGYLGDGDLAGALTTLRADTVNVSFNTGTATNGTAMRVDARGRTSASIADATLRFAGARPIQLDALYANKASLNATTALSILSLTMRDYLLLSTPNGSVALQGNGTAPAATRTASTGALSNAKLVMTPGSDAPAVTVNGAAK